MNDSNRSSTCQVCVRTSVLDLNLFTSPHDTLLPVKTLSFVSLRCPRIHEAILRRRPSHTSHTTLPSSVVGAVQEEGAAEGEVEGSGCVFPNQFQEMRSLLLDMDERMERYFPGTTHRFNMCNSTFLRPASSSSSASSSSTSSSSASASSSASSSLPPFSAVESAAMLRRIVQFQQTETDAAAETEDESSNDGGDSSGRSGGEDGEDEGGEDEGGEGLKKKRKRSKKEKKKKKKKEKKKQKKAVKETKKRKKRKAEAAMAKMEEGEEEGEEEGRDDGERCAVLIDPPFGANAELLANTMYNIGWAMGDTDTGNKGSLGGNQKGKGGKGKRGHSLPLMFLFSPWFHESNLQVWIYFKRYVF